MRIIVGLGNPGRQYENTRHNIGFMAVDRLAEKLDAPVNKLMMQSLTGQALVEGERVILVKPLTYMNLSGQAVGSIMRWYKLSPTEVMVIYDDMDLPFGTLRLRGKGGDGGHNGIKSIIEHLSTKEFARLRVGIGKPQEPGPGGAGWVLGRLSPGETGELDRLLDDISRAVLMFLGQGLDAAMNKFNVRL